MDDSSAYYRMQRLADFWVTRAAGMWPDGTPFTGADAAMFEEEAEMRDRERARALRELQHLGQEYDASG